MAFSMAEIFASMTGTARPFTLSTVPLLELPVRGVMSMRDVDTLPVKSTRVSAMDRWANPIWRSSFCTASGRVMVASFAVGAV